MRSAVLNWLVVIASLAYGIAGTGSSVASEPPYVVRGKQTEVRQHTLKDRLDHLHEALAELFKRHAPDLLAKLEPPPPIEYGYRLLPRIILDSPPKPPPKPQTVSYSWDWSDTLISKQMAELDRIEADLKKTQSSLPAPERAACESLLGGYKTVIEHRRRIDSDIDYNWIWQAAIAKDRPTFDRVTKRLDEVAELQNQGKPLTPEIIAAISAVNLPAYVRIEQGAGRRRVIVVPVSTDITEAHFVQTFKKAVESVWRGRIGEEEVRLRLDIETIPPERLYPVPPRKGEKIDLVAHAALFPKNRVVLTTGAASLRIVAGPALVVSPHDVASRVLAHEFGHILGFPDAYFRGYRDLGTEGFRIMELVTDSADLMSSPGSGLVQERHLKSLVDSIDIRDTMQAGLDALYQNNNPVEAVARFRRVLERKPTHYGATYQLAKALDRSGHIAEAKLWWKKILEMAEAIGDNETAATARKGLE